MELFIEIALGFVFGLVLGKLTAAFFWRRREKQKTEAARRAMEQEKFSEKKS